MLHGARRLGAAALHPPESSPAWDLDERRRCTLYERLPGSLEMSYCREAWLAGWHAVEAPI